jgi:aerobic carbon-monoxide dehydrogenase medium subunit
VIVKPAPFEYHRAWTADEVVQTLTELGEDAKVIAGGQSLAPMMNFRLARPSALVDINTVTGLDYIEREGDELKVGALTRHRAVEINRDAGVVDGFALLPRAARWIGHYPIRCRGTVGGSIAHSDPTAEWCLLARLYDATIVVLGPEGTRSVRAEDWFTGFLTTSGAYNEMVVETRFARPRSHGALTDVGIALGGVASEPLRATEAEQLLEGAPAQEDSWDDAARSAAARINPPSDLNGDADYRRHLVDTLTRRAFAEALQTGAPR